jgi:hypothetical protein
MRGMDVVFHAAGVVDYWRQGVERMYQVNNVVPICDAARCMQTLWPHPLL